MAKRVDQVVTAFCEDGKLIYKSGRHKGARLMFEVPGRARIYVRGALKGDAYERLTLDLMRKCAKIGLPVSELRVVKKTTSKEF